MAGESNLVPQNMRTKEEQRRIASMGGKASSAARRRRKTLKESMNALLELPIKDEKELNKVKNMGISLQDIDNSQLIVLALFNKAKTGDVAAIRELRELIGEALPQTEQQAQLAAQEQLIGAIEKAVAVED